MVFWNILVVVFAVALITMLLYVLTSTAVMHHERASRKNKICAEAIEANELMQAPISDKIPELNKQYVNLLSKGGIVTVSDLVSSTKDELLKIPGIKEGRVKVIEDALSAHHLNLGVNHQRLKDIEEESNAVEFVYEDEFFDDSPLYRFCVLFTRSMETIFGFQSSFLCD